MPSGCADNSNPVCDSSAYEIQKSFNGSAASSDIASSVNVTSASARDYQLGDIKSPATVSDVGGDSASAYCAHLNFSQVSDWHLPSKTELAMLYCNSKAVHNAQYPQELPGCYASNLSYGSGGPMDGLNFNLDASRGTTIYISSTEADANNVWAQDFSDGRQFTISKSQPAGFRCIRHQFGVK